MWEYNIFYNTLHITPPKLRITCFTPHHSTSPNITSHNTTLHITPCVCHYFSINIILVGLQSYLPFNDYCVISSIFFFFFFQSSPVNAGINIFSPVIDSVDLVLTEVNGINLPGSPQNYWICLKDRNNDIFFLLSLFLLSNLFFSLFLSRFSFSIRFFITGIYYNST